MLLVKEPYAIILKSNEPRKRETTMRYLKLLVGILSVSASIPLAAQTRSSLEDLEARIVSTANENPGEYGIAALDLTTGQMIGVNTNTPYPMASTMKIVVAAAYLDDIDKGSRSLDDTIAGSSAYSLMDRMMVKSDNHATDLLIARLGGPSAIDDWLEAKKHPRHSCRQDDCPASGGTAQSLGERRYVYSPSHADAFTAPR